MLGILPVAQCLEFLELYFSNIIVKLYNMVPTMAADIVASYYSILWASSRPYGKLLTQLMYVKTCE